MGLSVKVDLSSYPQGIPVGIVGMGVVENGGTLEVEPAMEEVFYSINGYTIEDGLADQEEMEVSGSAEFTPEEPPTAPGPGPSNPIVNPPDPGPSNPPDETPPPEEGGE